MKKNLLLATLFSLLLLSCNFSSRRQDDNTSGTISISGAFALYPMAVRWTEEYKKIHPEIRFDVSAGGAGKGITDALSTMVDIGLVSRELHPEEINRGAWYIAVSRDAVLPTLSALNPHLDEILNTGMKKDVLEKIFIRGTIQSWSQCGVKSNLPVHVYTRSDASGAAESWANYFGKKHEDLQGIGVFGDPGLEQAVMKDPSGIGYNNLIYLYDSKTKKQMNGIRVLPIDFNNNGLIDVEENFYNTIDELVAAIAAEKYPSRNLFFVTKGKPQKKSVTEFITWVLGDGQQYVREVGYVGLSGEKIQEELGKLE